MSLLVAGVVIAVLWFVSQGDSARVRKPKAPKPEYLPPEDSVADLEDYESYFAGEITYKGLHKGK